MFLCSVKLYDMLSKERKLSFQIRRERSKFWRKEQFLLILFLPL